jgi:hypothetical protein
LLRSITFNKELWKLSSFESISYDKQKEILWIHTYETDIQFHSIDEQLLFNFLIAIDKEGFIENKLKPTYLVSSIHTSA